MAGTKETARKAAIARLLYPLVYIDERDNGWWAIYANGKEYRHASLAQARQLHNAQDVPVLSRGTNTGKSAPPAQRDPVRQAAYTRAREALRGYAGTTLTAEQQAALRAYEGPEISGNPDRIRKR